MTSNPEPIVQQLPCEFQNLLSYVTGPEAGSQTAYTVERTLFRLLTLGAALLRLFFVTRATVRPAEPVTASNGTRLTAHDQRPTTYYVVQADGKGAPDGTAAHPGALRALGQGAEADQEEGSGCHESLYV